MKIRWSVYSLNKWYVIIVMLMCFYFFISGCAGGKVYLLHLKYIPPDAGDIIPEKEQTGKIGVKTFVDVRTEKEDVGRRVRSGGRVDIFRPYFFPVNEAVTRAVKDYLLVKGYEIVHIEDWDFTPEDLSNIPGNADIVIGGEVKRLWSSVESSITHTKIKSSFGLLVYIGWVNEGKVVVRKVESTPEVTEILYNKEKVERNIDNTMTEVIEKTLSDFE